MVLLLDTCAALWWWEGSESLSAVAAAALEDKSNQVLFHQVSFLEISIKHSLGKLSMTEAPPVLIPKALDAYQIGYRPLGNRDINRMAALPWYHRDPFDRLLIAHALEHSLTVVTSDRKFASYGVAVLW